MKAILFSLILVSSLSAFSADKKCLQIAQKNLMSTGAQEILDHLVDQLAKFESVKSLEPIGEPTTIGNLVQSAKTPEGQAFRVVLVLYSNLELAKTEDGLTALKEFSDVLIDKGILKAMVSPSVLLSTQLLLVQLKADAPTLHPAIYDRLLTVASAEELKSPWR